MEENKNNGTNYEPNFILQDTPEQEVLEESVFTVNTNATPEAAPETEPEVETATEPVAEITPEPVAEAVTEPEIELTLEPVEAPAPQAEVTEEPAAVEEPAAAEELVLEPEPVTEPEPAIAEMAEPEAQAEPVAEADPETPLDLDATQTFDRMDLSDVADDSPHAAPAVDRPTIAIGNTYAQNTEPDAVFGNPQNAGTEHAFDNTQADTVQRKRPDFGWGNMSARDMDDTMTLHGAEHLESSSFPTGPAGAYRDPRENFARRGPEAYNNFNSASGYDQVPPAGKKQKKQKPPKQKKQPKPVTMTRKGLGLLIASVMAIAMVFGGGTGYVVDEFLDDDNGTTATTSEQSASTLENATNSGMSIAEITAKTKDSVVEIRTEGVGTDSWMQQYVTEGAGSGVIISADGYIMTNNHVIAGANKIKVTTSDEKEYAAELVGTDSINDIAVLKIEAEGLTAATYGNSDEIQVGDLAVAIGNPLGELGGTVTSGIISAQDRELSIDGKTMKLLQTDSSINPGNSGGGLFNDRGQLIGIVVAKSSGSDVEGLGFAIPINTASETAKQIMEQGYASGHPSTGMAYQETSGSQMGGLEEYFFGEDAGQGAQVNVYIAEVNGENAKAAGFQPGDMVYAIDGTVINSFDQLSEIITSKKPGDKVTYTIVREGQTQDISFELEEKKN